MTRTVAGLATGLLALFLTLTLSQSAQAQDATRFLAARAELHPIATLTLSDEALLAGDASQGKPVTIAVNLRLPPRPGKLPAVVLIHGSGGIGSNIDLWEHELNELGIATVAIDGFTGRGIVSTSANQATLGRLNMSLDAYRVLEMLARHPRIDPQRVALMGFSRGGQGTLYASMKRLHSLWNRSGVEFAAYVPFYPDCMTTYRNDTQVADRPIRIFHGTPDDYNPVAACKPYVQRLRDAGHDVVLTEYANAQHGFDSPLTPVTVATGSQTVRACRIREDEQGRLINAETGARFTYQDACVQKDPHVGYDPAATLAVREALRAFYTGLFKLPETR